MLLGRKFTFCRIWATRRGISSTFIPFIEKENENFSRFCRKTETLRKELYDEAVSMLVPEGMSPPELNKSFYYFQRYDESGFLKFGRVPADPSGSRLLLDIDKDEIRALEEEILSVRDLSTKFSENGFTDVSVAKISNDNSILGFVADYRGNEKWSLSFRDIVHQRYLSPQLPLVRNFEWIDNTLTPGRYFYFTEIDPVTLRSVRVARAELDDRGGVIRKKSIVWELPETDTTSYVDLFKSKDGKFIFMSSSSKVSSQVFVVPADDPEASPILIQPAEPGVEYYCEHRNGFIYMVSNKEFVNFALYRMHVSDPRRTCELVYHSPDLTIRDMDMFRKGVVLYGTGFEGQPAVEIIRFEGSVDPNTVPADPSDYERFGVADIVKVPFKGNYAVGKIEIGINGDFDADVCRFTFRNPRNPGTCLEFRFFDRKLEAVKSREFQRRANLDIIVDRVAVPSSDGLAEIPLTLVVPEDRDINQPQPCLIHVYGAYGQVLEPDFSPAIISLLKRGWCVAFAHVRGGGERGPEWHASGSKKNRINGILDLEACCQFLIAENLTRPHLICAVGASAGGVVLGSTLNKYGKSLIGGAAILRVPFVDLFNTLKDPTLPLSSHEKDEWGDPNDLADAPYIESVSPTDNIVTMHGPQWYPRILITSAEDDARVPFEGVVKYAQKMRSLIPCPERLIVRTNRSGEGGHFGSASSAGSYEDSCIELAYILESVKDSHNS